MRKNIVLCGRKRTSRVGLAALRTASATCLEHKMTVSYLLHRIGYNRAAGDQIMIASQKAEGQMQVQ